MIPEINIHHADCIAFMRTKPDGFYDLAIVDPPYGIGDKFKSSPTSKMNFNEIVNKGWDATPPPEYWAELFRVSKNQIVWGGNYFPLPPTRCWVVWDKHISENFSMAMAELAWTSFDALVKIVRLPVPKDGRKIHPTQKPVALYQWMLNRYAKAGDRILYTHGGSMSQAIACDLEGFDLDIVEIDAEYFKNGVKRFQIHKAQNRLF